MNSFGLNSTPKPEKGLTPPAVYGLPGSYLEGRLYSLPDGYIDSHLVSMPRWRGQIFLKRFGGGILEPSAVPHK